PCRQAAAQSAAASSTPLMPTTIASSDAALPQPVPSLAVLPSNIRPPQATTSCPNTKIPVQDEGNGSPAGFLNPIARLAAMNTKPTTREAMAIQSQRCGRGRSILGSLSASLFTACSLAFLPLDVTRRRKDSTAPQAPDRYADCNAICAEASKFRAHCPDPGLQTHGMLPMMAQRYSLGERNDTRRDPQDCR